MRKALWVPHLFRRVTLTECDCFRWRSILRREQWAQTVRVTLESGHHVQAARAVIATNSPISPRVALHTKLAPYRTYAMGFEIPRGALADTLYWDTADPYHYVRLTPGTDGNDILIVGGADHKTGEADDAAERFDGLEQWIRPLVPALLGERYRWSGQVLEPLDHCAFIGRVPDSDRLFVATGDSGQGMTHGAVAGLLIPDLIEGKENAWEPVYDPSRKPHKSVLTYVSENLTAARRFMEYVALGERASAEDLRPGEGAIIREGMTKIAAYRAPDGTLHRRSAACSHLGCHLHWNSFERCWDCPCHGSHFAPDGQSPQRPRHDAPGRSRSEGMMRQPQARPDPLLADSLVSGVAVGSVTSVVLALLSRSKGRRPAEPIGWTSHWYRGEDMNRRRAVSPSYVLLGLVTHLAASVLWGAVYQLVRRTRRDRPAALDALGVSAVAALVDYGMVPRRLTPGWENALGPAAITAVYASMALALLATSADPKAGAGLT